MILSNKVALFEIIVGMLGLASFAGNKVALS